MLSMNQSSPQPDDVWVGLAKTEGNEEADPKQHSQEQQQHDIRLIHVRGLHHELTTSVVEVQSSSYLPMGVISLYSTRILVHPVLWEFLALSTKKIETSPVPPCNSWFEALPMQRYPINSKQPVPCHQAAVQVTVRGSEACLSVTVQVLYHESPGSSVVTASIVQESLLGRFIRAKSTLLLAPHNMLIVIHDISEQDGEHESEAVFRVANNTSYIHVNLLQPTTFSETSLINPNQLIPRNVPDHESCPGYETLLDELVRLLRLQKHRPTGILLVGGAGVGKTRMAACITRRWNDGPVCWWSLSSEKQLDGVSPGTSLYVVDGLHCLKGDNELDKQKLASIAVVLDRCTALGIPVLATGRAHHVEPLTKAGRLEVTTEMQAPDQHQRETILSQWIPRWGKGLAQLTAGCVAADLLPLQQAADDATSWNQLTGIANAIVPSQLAALDVQKPQRMLLSTNPEDWAHHHSLCFNNLAGYESVKRQLYRTVVLPWRRRVQDDPSCIAPPTGVLFHGPSGCGKTMAAQCLASSLGLPMIHVRAATEVLSPWVGGSEELVQSLFAKARYAAPCILFLDEIDSMASNRDDTGSGGVMSRVLSTLLNEMDGVTTTTSRRQVLVMACSNRKESLDAALLRPGRLEEHILLDIPSSQDIRDILIHCLSRTPHETTELDRVVDRLGRMEASGADVYGLCREAVLQALRNGADRVGAEDFNSAFLF